MGCKDIGIRNSKFVAKTQFLMGIIWCMEIEYIFWLKSMNKDEKLASDVDF